MNGDINSIAVYYDDYSKMYKNAQDIEKYGPFIVQTPALGMKPFKRPSRIGAYRVIKIKNGMLSSFQVKYIPI